MEYIRVKNISESDFDAIVKDAGGVRISSEGSADYLLNEALIELKFVQDEGFEKPTRQKKIANLFHALQPHASVVIVNPDLLDKTNSRDYYNIVAGPIKTHVKKADKQLEATAQRYNPKPIRVLVILNLGYTALSPDEFKSVCFKCVLNDTTKIDWVVCGGIYFHSDKMDNYLFARFEPVPINVNRTFPSYDALANSWGSFVERLATSLIREITPPDQGRLPVLDLAFEVDGIRYVKPSPAMPKSNFWPSGRAPRDNTSGLTKCPPVARVFPALSVDDWKLFKEKLPTIHNLQSSYKDWQSFQASREHERSEILKPLVILDVKYSSFTAWISKPSDNWQFADICEFATHLFELRIRDILERLKDKEKTKIIPPEYIYLIVHEIGQDEVNDLCSIYYVSETPGFEREEVILKNEKLFFKYGVVVAASYAVKRKVDVVFYSKRQG